MPADAGVQALGQVHGVCDADDGEAGALAAWPLKQVVQHRLQGRVDTHKKRGGGASFEIYTEGC